MALFKKVEEKDIGSTLILASAEKVEEKDSPSASRSHPRPKQEYGRCFRDEFDPGARWRRGARMGSEDGGGGELALPAAEPTMRDRIYPRIFWRYSSAGK
jgi:hypothetical protein